MKIRTAISIVGLLLIVVGIYVFLNNGFRELPPIFFWGLILLLFRFFLSRRGLGWKIAAFVAGWFELATLFGAITKAAFLSDYYASRYWQLVSWAELIISVVVSAALVYYLPFGPLTPDSKAEDVPNSTDAP